MITTRFTGNINSFEDNWCDIKNGPIMNIRVAGTYPHKNCDHNKHCKSPFMAHGIPVIQCFNQHKPYGVATVHMDFGDDDRPDWLHFKGERKRRQYEEIMPGDAEFHDVMVQDHKDNMSHNHVHLKSVEEDTTNEEIETEVTL